MKLMLAVLLSLITCLHAQDGVIRYQGPPLQGKILGTDASGLRVQVVVVPGQPPAMISLRLAQIKEVIFGDSANLAGSLKTASLAQLANLWQQREALLGIPGSLAGEIGIVYANRLLSSPAKQAALPLFERLLAKTTDENLKSQAAEGRLQALVAVGRAAEAVDDAKTLAAQSENPAILIQAKFILAEASFQQLKKLVEDNPKWEEDVNIRPRRNQLYHETLDLYLFPSLFHGAETEPAARGLWNAIQVCKSGGELPEARELARDIEVLYPSSSYVAEAKAFVQTLTPELQNQNYEKQKD